MELLATDLEVMAQLDDDAQHCDDWAIDDDFIAQAQDGEGKGSDYEHEAGDGEFEEGEEGEYFDTDDEERGPASDRGYGLFSVLRMRLVRLWPILATEVAPFFLGAAYAERWLTVDVAFTRTTLFGTCG